MFSNIKVGDKVTICKYSYSSSNTYREGIVSKVNKVTFQVDCFTFRKTDGKRYGDEFSRTSVEPYNEELINNSILMEKKKSRFISLKNQMLKAIEKMTIEDIETLEKLNECFAK